MNLQDHDVWPKAPHLGISVKNWKGDGEQPEDVSSVFEQAFPHQRSGGRQHRVGIARALAVEPDVLLMDEPFGALDAQTRLILQDELLRICSAYKATVMFITHDIEEAIYLSDKIIVMSRRPGEIKFVVDVTLPKPRFEHDVRSSPDFLALRNSIWNALREELRETP